MIFDRHPENREKCNRHFWARGYYCETVGNVNEEMIKKYIEEQYKRIVWKMNQRSNREPLLSGYQ